MLEGVATANEVGLQVRVLLGIEVLEELDSPYNTVTATLNRAGVPSRDEIQDLIGRLEVLTEKVDKLASK